jgi:hypothetical protein
MDTKAGKEMTDRELMQMALDALVLNNQEWKQLADSGDAGWWKAEDQDHYHHTELTIKALRDRLEQPEREWIDLTSDEGAEIWADCHDIEWKRTVPPKEIVKRISDKLKEKNT